MISCLTIIRLAIEVACRSPKPPRSPSLAARGERRNDPVGPRNALAVVVGWIDAERVLNPPGSREVGVIRPPSPAPRLTGRWSPSDESFAATTCTHLEGVARGPDADMREHARDKPAPRGRRTRLRSTTTARSGRSCRRTASPATGRTRRIASQGAAARPPRVGRDRAARAARWRSCPGDPEASELIARVTEEDESLRMPPRKSGNRLAAAEIDLLKRWIAQGASYAEHWAFVAAGGPAAAGGEGPAVAAERDRFLDPRPARDARG